MYIPTIQDILNNDNLYSGEEQQAALENFKKEVWNAAIDKAAVEAKTITHQDELGVYPPEEIIDTRSILKLKI